MNMSYRVEFSRHLEDLFKRRTVWLRTVIDKKRPGAPQKFARAHVNKAIAEMQELASLALADRLAKREFERLVHEKRSWHPKRGKGRGVDNKRRRFKEWYSNEVATPTCVYVFWNGPKCVYVGRTELGSGRVTAHFEKAWFSAVSRIDIYMTSGHRGLAALECLATHRFRPTKNKARPAEKKWTSKCPLCKVHRDIESELRQLFRFK
jgi:hypothetical protein